MGWPHHKPRTTIKKLCVFCAKEYGVTRRDSKYCSDVCRDKVASFARKGKAGSLSVVVCSICQKDFRKTHGGQKFCSPTCRRKSNYQKHLLPHREMAAKYQKTPNGKYVSYKRSATARDIKFSMTKEEFLAFWNRPCAYCGGEVQTVRLDRVDSAGDYTVDNVVSCCAQCNYGKLTWTAEEYIEHCHKVAAMNPLKPSARV